MSERVRTNVGRWGSLLIALILLVFCLFLLGSHAAAVAAQASPPTDPRPPVPYKGVQAPPTMSTKDAAAPALRRPALQTTGAEFTGERAGASGGIAPLGQPIATTGFTLDLGQNALWGLVNPGDLVTATLTSEGIYAAAEADGVGFFWSYFWLDDGKPADIDDGDTVEVYVNGALAATLDPFPISGRMDILADEVTGSVTGLGAGTAVTVTLGDFDDMIADEPQVVTSVDAMGDLSADFAGIADLGPHTSAQIQYRDANGHAFQDSFHPSKVFRVKDWWAVEGYAMPGDVVTVTVYMTYPTDVRWSQTVQASTPKGFYGAYDDIEYNDVVEVDLGGTFLQVTASALELWPDAASDQIHGWADLATGTSVRGTIWDEFEGSYAEAIDTLDASGNFTLAFSTDLRTGHWPYVAYADGDGDEVGISTPPPHLRAYPLFSGLYAVADGPHQPVTYTVDTGSEIWTQTAWCGKLNTCEMAYFDSLEPGYVLTAEFSGGGTNSMTVADVSMVPDTAGDSLSGQADIPGWLDVTLCQWNSGPANGCGLGGVAANPSYAISFPNLDVRDGMQLYLYHYDDTDGNRTFVSQGNMETPYFEVYPWGVGGVPPQADEHVTAYLYDADGTTLLASTDDDQDWDPWRFWFGDWQGYSIEPGHWVTVTADSGWTAGLQVPTLTIQADTTTDLIWGDAPKSSVFVEHEWWDGDWMWDGRWVPVDGYVLDRAYFGADLQNGNYVHVAYQHPNGNRVRQSMTLGELFRVEFSMETDGSTSMWGQAQAGEMVTITTPYTEVYRLADPGCNGCWDAYVEQLYPGDPVTVTDGLGEDPLYVTIADPLTANADSDADEVWGQIGGWSEQIVQVHGEWEDGYREVTTNASGEYLASYGDVPPSGRGYIRWETTEGYTQVVYHRRFQAPDLLMSVNYGHDWVEGNYEPGHTLWLTVTDDVGQVQATIELQTQIIPWWGGQSGFSTNLEGVTWVPDRPDIQEGWWVYGHLDNGQTAEVQIGTITGALDLDNDSIAGTVSAPWFTGMLNANCGVWEDSGPGADFQVDADGGAYTCDFGAMGWDLQPGHDVGVQYQGLDGHWVINVFRAPAPNAGIEKWAEGSGQAAPGGQVVYTLRYRNDGDAEATTLYLTDTLPASTTYVADTSGVTPTPGPGYVVWALGPLAPGEQKQFQLVLNNSAGEGDTLVNQADIWTLYDDDDSNNHAEARVSITDEQPDLYVSKNPIPGDPVPGQTMLWEIDYGNNGPVASGAVVLTDTLPEDTSIVDWSSQNGYNVWVDHSTADQLILEAPTVPGYWGDRILLRLLVDGSVEVGTQLTNTVEITTAHDSDPNNNEHMRNDVWTSESRWDSYVDKNLGWGRLVPGGEIEYNLYIRNHGNMAAHIVLTDELPEGTSISEAWDCTEPICVPLPPDSVVDQVATWDLGTMEPGAWLNLNLRVDIAGDVEPGTVLTNCAEVTSDGDEGWALDNTDCVVDTVQSAGPNLRIDKSYQWNGDGQIEYTIEFRNLGTTTLYDVEITDTLPDDTSFNGNQWNWYWEKVDFAQDGNELTWTISKLDPGSSSGLRYQTDLDGGLIGVQGLCYTNAAQAAIPGDVWPDDNADQVTACTGPDVYIEKWVSAGVPEPGAILTFTVEFGNKSRWPWNGNDQVGSHITETLPAGMTFITATAPWNPDEAWQPETIDGNTITWGCWTMWADSRWRFDVVVQIDDTVEGGDVLVNTIKAKGDSPDDIEPDTDNNSFDLPVTVLGPVLGVSKTYDTNRVAGTVVTYTLSVANSGNAPATGATLIDTLPTGLTYLDSDGSNVVGDVVWTLASIAAGGTAEGWFSAELACQPGQSIVNDTYGVASSDQGVEAWGTAVSFTTIAPTIQVAVDHDPKPALVGQTVTFEATATTNGTALTYEWDFGEGAVSGGPTATHSFAQAGSYEVSVTVTDACGFYETASTTVQVEEGLVRVYLPTVQRKY